mmetsp:Transcript_15218/g.20358  ORF Transcript_15218/g.20358 Transcript_15218/m.20358 type:complete len:158 (-) Transcript_15218:257-730(-)
MLIYISFPYVLSLNVQRVVNLQLCAEVGNSSTLILFYNGSIVFFSNLLLAVVENSSCDTIKILLSDARHPPSTIGVSLNDLHFTELEENTSDNTGISLTEVLSSGSLAVRSSIPLSELTNSKAGSKVNLTGDGGSTDVIPVITIWGKLLEDGSLNKV